MESLCVVVGKSVWSIRVDLHIVDNGGYGKELYFLNNILLSNILLSNADCLFLIIRNLIDAANIAALAALLTFRRPDCTLGGDDGQELIMHDAEVKSNLITSM